LEWGGGNEAFLFQIEGDVLFKLVTNPTSVIHPFIVFPLAAQVALLVTLFQKKPSKRMTFWSMGGLGILLVLVFVIGWMTLNYKMIFSTLPFIVVSAVTIRHYRLARG
jgi:hypothetical protein